MTWMRVAFLALAASLAAPTTTLAASVQIGLERLAASGGKPLKGKKVGLIANAASVTERGERSQDVLRDLGVDVVRLFAPEHGLSASVPAGSPVRDEPGAELPVVSLYGPRSKPAPADLEGLDALVYDLQDAGVRFYTYASTLLLGLDAAAEAGVEFVVLDRPNPLGGLRMEGPASSPEVPPSLVNMTPGPLVHGLTAGELARFANEKRTVKAKLRVVEMAGWKRSMVWADTGRPWVPPSPNLLSPDAALAYPGLALLEGTNISEGRGTEAPFLLAGAPGVRPTRLAGIRVPGFALELARFVPRNPAGGTEVKHAGRECLGVAVRVQDPAAAQPYRLGISLLYELRWDPEFQWLRSGAALDDLLGTRAVRAALQRGDGVEAVLALDGATLSAWATERQKALIYR